MIHDDRAFGPTFAASQLGWIDFESKSETDIRQAGAVRYATEADAVILAYAIGDGPVGTWAVKGFPATLEWGSAPEPLRRHHERVIAGEAVWAAWNAGFDRAVWNYATSGFPQLEPHHLIDVMAQAYAAGLPPDLGKASQICGGVLKQVDEGKRLIKLFCLPGSTATPQSHPQDWAAFLSYAGDDIGSMRSVFRCTRQLALAEWREYWAMERSNERGVLIDLPMAKHAADLAAIDRKRANSELVEITAGAVPTVDSVGKMTMWLMGLLPPEGQAILTKREEEVDEESGEIIKPAKYALTRRRVGILTAMIGDMLASDKVKGNRRLQLLAIERVLQIRFFGGSKTPAKYSKMLAQHVDGHLYGQYVFNGAGQTGRASSRGVQVHNLARDFLPYEHDAIESVLARVDYDSFALAGDLTPVSRKLSLLIRPTFIAWPGHSFVWSDWSQIEARVLPWLAGDDEPGALARLDIFREVDRDPNKPDLYTRTAAELSHVAIAAVTKPMRQRGKVAELALGFGGGVGALQSMAANYGMYLKDEEARETVSRWRDANPWCVRFWGRHDDQISVGLWGAINRALEQPGVPQHAGRIVYVFLRDYLEGSLVCVLPSGRCLTYRRIRYERVEELDDDDNPTGVFSTKLRFARGYGRVVFWHGMACENVVQAVAADFLRGTLVRLERDGLCVRLHTHDEILTETEDENVDMITVMLRKRMREGFSWSKGLPIMSDETEGPYYSKWEAA